MSSTSQTTRVITVTGTKGKTSVVRALHFILSNVEKNTVLGVDTDQVSLGSQKIFGRDASVNNAGYVPSICPGRFLALLPNNGAAAVLEASVGCYRFGLGYREHAVGVFTNVFDDHLGMQDYITTRKDIATAKATYIFGSIKRGGYAVVNIDDDLVRDSISEEELERKGVTVIACGLQSASLERYPIYASADSNGVYIQENGFQIARLNFSETPWLLGGAHEPSTRNALSVLAALRAFYGAGETLSDAVKVAKQYSVDEFGGRMVTYKTHGDVKIIMDYAHEKESLKQIARYARTLTTKDGKVFGIIRMDSSRSDDFICNTGMAIGGEYDEIIVYDKDMSKGSSDYPGSSSQALLNGVKQGGCSSSQLIAKDVDALQYARDHVRPGDVVIYIINTMNADYKKVNDAFGAMEKI